MAKIIGSIIAICLLAIAITYGLRLLAINLYALSIYLVAFLKNPLTVSKFFDTGTSLLILGIAIFLSLLVAKGPSRR